jgi:cyclopropane-fatty-acyl-phospholipid synthase
MYGCRVTSLTLSKEQKALAEQRIQDAGLSDKITVLLCDYRNLDTTQKFDRIVTVEMLEAVGPEFLPVFFDKCDQLLDPRDGLLVLQVITMPEHRYKNYLKTMDFIQKHIFPGGHCPTVTALVQAIEQGSKGNLILDHMINIGPHYAKALRLWREKFMDSFDSIATDSEMKSVYTQEFKRKWEFYFAYCEAGFASGTLGDVQMRLTRSANKSLLDALNVPM